MEHAKKKYGLTLGVAMVIGTVLGCGVFIKAGDVLKASGGSLIVSLIAWLIGGVIMIASGLCFAIYANRVEKFNGCVDYVEYASNKKVGYFFAYYLGMICFPIEGSHVAIIGGHYLVTCFTIDKSLNSYTSYPVIIVALILLATFFLINYLAPKISSKYQVSVLFVKVAPILFVAILGAIAPLLNKGCPGIIGAFKENATVTGSTTNFGDAIKITSFAYDGWICAAALNAEMKDSKRNLPKAIIGGTIALLIFYLIYFIGLSAVIGNQKVVDSGQDSAGVLFFNIFGQAGATIFMIFIFLSCTGNVNAMTICASRSLIALGVRDVGFMPNKMREIKKDNFTITPFLFTFCLMLFYFILWELAYAKIPFFVYLDSMDEIVCAIIYAPYILVYIYMMKNFKEENFAIRFIMPIVAIIGSIFFVLCGTGIFQAISTFNLNALISFGVFLFISSLIYIPGIIFFIKDKNKFKRASNEK